jgi:transposase
MTSRGSAGEKREQRTADRLGVAARSLFDLGWSSSHVASTLGISTLDVTELLAATSRNGTEPTPAQRRKSPNRTIERTCIECGERFMATRTDHVICDARCQTRRARRRAAQARQEPDR